MKKLPSEGGAESKIGRDFFVDKVDLLCRKKISRSLSGTI